MIQTPQIITFNTHTHTHSLHLFAQLAESSMVQSVSVSWRSSEEPHIKEGEEEDEEKDEEEEDVSGGEVEEEKNDSGL